MLGYRPQVILAGRGINDAMGPYTARRTIKEMVASGFPVKDQPVLVLGMTFKEDVPDIRNSKVIDVIRELRSFGCNVIVHDPIADEAETMHEYGVKLTKWEDIPKSAAMVVAVGHKEYKNLPFSTIAKKLHPGAIITDIKSMLPAEEVRRAGMKLWRL
jgi:UDP-N-acetyl-D-glucosamine/UDP-N-acetyl-D-galactosamine dehydrogenase